MLSRASTNNNFGILRYLLALSILLSHISGLTGQSISWPLHPTDGVKGFFIISGFLVGLSYLNSKNFLNYFNKRLRRLMPAYWCSILFCLIIAVIVTDLAITEFLKHPQTIKYIIYNTLTLNFLQPSLPEVFSSHNLTAMNGSLWTTKVEILLYLSVPLVFTLCLRWNKGIVILIVCTLSFIYSETCLYLSEVTNNKIYEILYRQGFGQIRFFYAGTLFLFYFDYFLKKARFFIPAALLIYLLPDTYFTRFLEPFALTSFIIGVAYLLPHCSFLQKHDNIAYGIYLYHFPIIQLFISLNLFEYNFKLASFLTIVTTIIIAQTSWNILEKRILVKQKRSILLPNTSS